MISRKNAWELADAAARLGEVVELARTDGPQTITLDGESVAVVTAPATGPTGLSFLEFCARWEPIVGDIELPLDRDWGELRDIEL